MRRWLQSPLTSILCGSPSKVFLGFSETKKGLCAFTKYYNTQRFCVKAIGFVSHPFQVNLDRCIYNPQIRNRKQDYPREKETTLKISLHCCNYMPHVQVAVQYLGWSFLLQILDKLNSWEGDNLPNRHYIPEYWVQSSDI